MSFAASRSPFITLHRWAAIILVPFYLAMIASGLLLSSCPIMNGGLAHAAATFEGEANHSPNNIAKTTEARQGPRP